MYQQAEFGHENECEIKINNQKGKIAPFSFMEIDFEFKSSKIGNLERFRIPCYVEDMIEPLFLDIQGTVKGPVLMYSSGDKLKFK